MSDRTGIHVKSIFRDKNGHFIMIKGSIWQKDTAILKVYVTNNTTKSMGKPDITEQRNRQTYDHN